MAKKRDGDRGSKASGREGRQQAGFRQDGSCRRRRCCRRRRSVLSTSGTALSQVSPADAIHWHYEADVVVIGAGCTGLPAAIRARDLGASVIVVDQNFDLGGKMLHSGAQVSLGGGDPLQLRDIAGEGDRKGSSRLRGGTAWRN